MYCYGSYERIFLKRMRKVARRKRDVDRVLERLVNVLSVVYAHVYFPTHSNGLKDVAGCLGCTWSEADASGVQSIVWRTRWEQTRGDEWKDKLTAYNLEDCAALRRVAEFVTAACIPAPQAPAATPGEAGTPLVAHVQDIDRLANDRKWGRVNFVHPDYEFINDRAYFDYQREKVFVRTSRTLRKTRAKGTASCNRRVRVTTRIRLTSSRCPSCGSEDLAVVPKGEKTGCRRSRVKRAFDLVFTAGGIRRKVIECRAVVQRCLRCGKDCVPDRHQRLDRHFHGMKSWAMYQHVAHCLSFDTVGCLFEEFFGLRIASPEIHMFKSLLARYYRATYRGLLRKILAGNLLHVDETEVKLRTGKGYVWVFTSLEEVVFMYRPTREGDFLRELLKDFRGVLVSDFFAAYDALDCPQQKCLIHLMRDMNQELLGNPFDEELRSITQPFGTLLRAVVATVDEYGLRRKYLKKHEGRVADFFRLLEGKSFRSEAAEALRGRLLKYKDKLYTFIRHDGVPWNNNNAENAIKRFAFYREDTVGVLKEKGLSDYLVLLSICQTCRYKGVSFLKFLLSREKDVDAFCRGKRRRRRPPALEMYPKGYTPPHRVRRRKAGSPDAGAAPKEKA
jgi:hypothetical protein